MLYRASCSAVLPTHLDGPTQLVQVPVVLEASEDLSPLPIDTWQRALAAAWDVMPAAVRICAVRDAATLAAEQQIPPEHDGLYLAVLGLPYERVFDESPEPPPHFPVCLVRPRTQQQLWSVWSKHVLRSWPMPLGQGELYAIQDACQRELHKHLRSGVVPPAEAAMHTVHDLWTVLLKLHYVLLAGRLADPDANTRGLSPSMRALADQVQAYTNKGPESWPMFPRAMSFPLPGESQ